MRNFLRLMFVLIALGVCAPIVAMIYEMQHTSEIIHNSIFVVFEVPKDYQVLINDKKMRVREDNGIGKAQVGLYNKRVYNLKIVNGNEEVVYEDKKFDPNNKSTLSFIK